MGGPSSNSTNKTPLRTPSSAVRSGQSNGSSTGGSAGRGGLTMYERSMLQKEERERKMKLLQDKMMSDCTFTPSRERTRSSSSQSVVSSIGASPSSVGTGDTMSVYSRLYHAETAASRAQRHGGGNVTDGATSGFQTPRANMSTPGRSVSGSQVHVLPVHVYKNCIGQVKRNYVPVNFPIKKRRTHYDDVWKNLN